MNQNVTDTYPLLDSIDSPNTLRKLKIKQLAQLCEELRQYLLESVSSSSGHLASGLGVVELTVALHYAYDTPRDHLIWDVGHQAYPHKILTGRKENLRTIRQKGGLHPFPWREESHYDVLSVGHASTSISAGLGLAIAAQQENLKNKEAEIDILDRKVVSVIGDGALTAGMAFEALNHAGDLNCDMLVILNDNDMSISENVGALNNHLAQLLSGKFYHRVREGSKKVLSNAKPLQELFRKTEESFKHMVTPSALFESLGFNYIGPVDGHDVEDLVRTIKNMRDFSGPQFLHVVTTKGKGYRPAEEDPIGYHGVPKFDLSQDSLPEKNAKSFSNVFGRWLCDTAISDSDSLVAITPAMREGSGMTEFAKAHPDKFIDVAIAEQHAVTLATGLAISGKHPVVAIYSTFLQRAYDQLIHDVAIMNLPILFAIDRAGIVGEDGPTHQGIFDLSFLRCIPNLTIMTPSDGTQCYQMLKLGYQLNAPAVVRYPRGFVSHDFEIKDLVLGKGVIYKKSSARKRRVAILNFGALLNEGMDAATEFDATVVDMRFVKPLDVDLLLELTEDHDLLVTLEQNVVAGGAGSAVIECLMAHKRLKPVLCLGLPDQFIESGAQSEIYADYQLDSKGIVEQINQYWC